jgi:hypothetical protein
MNNHVNNFDPISINKENGDKLKNATFPDMEPFYVCKLPRKVRTCIITSFEKKSSQKAYHL